MDLTFPKDHSPPVVTYIRIVLLGKTGTGKSATGNSILGRKSFDSAMSASSVTSKSKREIGHFNDRTVSVIDTPGIYDTSLTEAQLKNEIKKCIELSVPGPHVFLLVVRLDCRFTREERNSINWIKENFGEDASKYTIVLFTRGDMLGDESVERFVDRSPDLTKVLRDSQRRYVVFDNTRMENRTQVSDLFEMIDRMVMLNGGHFTSSTYEEVQRKILNNEWWRKCSNGLGCVSSHLLVGATLATAGPAAAAVITEEQAVVSMGSLAMFAVAGASKVLSKWLRPRSTDEEGE